MDRAYGVRGALQLTPEDALMARERRHRGAEARIPGAVNPGPIVCVCGASVSPSLTAQEEVRGTERKHPKPNLTGHGERTGSLRGVMVTASARPPALSFSHCEAIPDQAPGLLENKTRNPTSNNTHAGFPIPGEAGFSGGAEGSQGSVLNQLLVQPEGERKAVPKPGVSEWKLHTFCLFLMPWADGQIGANGFVIPKAKAPFGE